jgi:Fur family transcriptional regulator, ferric uptake regulator
MNALTQAEALIRRHGRATPARMRVLADLLEAPRALTHGELEQQQSHPLDRVTLYRVLDWLVQEGLAHKIAGEDRVWRFNANAAEAPTHSHRHAHFRCTHCGKVYCLEQIGTACALDLPAGFRAEAVELTVTGCCPECP